MSRVGKSTETENRLVVTGGWRDGYGREASDNGCGFLLELMKMF